MTETQQQHRTVLARCECGVGHGAVQRGFDTLTGEVLIGDRRRQQDTRGVVHARSMRIVQSALARLPAFHRDAVFLISRQMNREPVDIA